MDPCFVDVTVEFLAVAFHNILYYASVFPKSIFFARKKYSVVVYEIIHPEVHEYVDKCLEGIAEALKNDQLHRVEFAVTDESNTPGYSFVFDFERIEDFDDTGDSYLIRSEQSIRAFCLQLATVSHKFHSVTSDSTFAIYLYTDEAIELALATIPDMEDFPFVETEEEQERVDNIMPLRRVTIRNYNIDTYLQLPKPWSFCS